MWIDEVDIVRVISSFVMLRKQDELWIGKCPWCEVEWLAVHGQLQIFHCFYCAAGGNAEQFLSRLQRPAEMPQAVRDELAKFDARMRKRTFQVVKNL